jgi:hypothetical protein
VTRALPLLLATLLTACSEPKAGDLCETISDSLCSTSSEALLCDSGSLTAIPCRGPMGCSKTTSGELLCDFSGAHIGDACPFSAETQAQCDVGDGNRALQCRATLWRAIDCRNCAEQNSQLICVP